MKARLQAVISSFLNAGGKRRYAYATLLGALLTLALPPIFFLPAAILALSGLFLLIERGSTTKQSFWIGWWFGLGHFSTGLYWFADALLTDPDKFAWLIPFAVLGIPAVLAIYIGCVSAATFKIPVQYRMQRLLFFAMFWLLAEWVRGNAFTGFPWNLTGYIWAFSDPMMQVTSVLGIWGLSYISILTLTSFALFIPLNNNEDTQHAKPVVIACMALLASLALWGYGRLQAHPLPKTHAGSRYVRIIQGNIPQPKKWDPAQQLSFFRKYLDLSSFQAAHIPSLIVWPETAVPFQLEQAPWARAAIARVTPENSYLITGGLRTEQHDSGFSIWNSLFVLDDKGEIKDYYDKNHLVPFGEYVPFRQFLPVEKITGGMVDFSTGHGATTLSVNGLPPFSPLICYEIIFPDNVVSKTKRPSLFINITNDAWFGVSTGPYQHFYMAKTRAVEQGIPLIRAANTGISTVIDAMGRILARTQLNETTVLDSAIPNSLKNGTIYSNFGFFPLVIILYFMGLPALWRSQL